MRTILAVLLVAGGLIVGCSSSNHHDKTTADRHDADRHDADRHDTAHRDTMDDHRVEPYSGTTVSRVSPREDWNSLQVDPVCDMTVNPKTAADYEYYGGKIYYFDTVDCRRRFHNNPSAYVPGDTHGEHRVQEVK
jgi:YHS domain-containing protein